jgi:hypothetical protein
MTDTNTSGATFAPAADTQAPAASAETPAGNFGSTRGSGLARGKRQVSASAPTENTAKSDYKPIALEVITPASEYKNPFASPEPENTPAAAPAKVEITAEPAPKAEAPAAVEPVAAAVPEPVAERREIHILPAAEAIRPAVSWESPSAARRENPSQDRAERPQRDERPTFRPDRREDAPAAEGAEQPRFDGRGPRNDSFQRQPRDPREARQPRDPREARQPRDPRDERQPRDPRFARQPRDPRDEVAREERPRHDQRPQHHSNGSSDQAAPAAKGFFGWLKSLFGGPKPAAEAPVARDREFGGERSGDGQRHRRRHRGGRGHGGNPQGYRGGERSFQGGPRQEGQQGEGENRGGERHGGGRRRRHRGGQGRDRGGEPRSEGHQGGGAI